MSMFDRFKMLVKSNANHAANKLEDPEKILNQLILDMRDQLIEAKKQVAVTIADEKRLRKQTEAELVQAQEWEKKAMMAVRAGRDDLAKEALRRKAEHDDLGQQYKTQWELQRAAAEKLKDSLRQLSRKIEEAERKKQLLISRQRQAQAQVQIQQTLNQLQSSSPLDRFAKMEDQIAQLEAQVEADQELGRDHSLEAQFAQLNKDQGMDSELERLKARMGQPSGTTSTFSFEEVGQTQRSAQEAPAPSPAGAKFRR